MVLLCKVSNCAAGPKPVTHDNKVVSGDTRIELLGLVERRLAVGYSCQDPGIKGEQLRHTANKYWPEELQSKAALIIAK